MGLAAAAAIGAVGAIGGGVIAASGAKSAANTSAAAADRASAVQQDIYSQNQQMLAPYVAAGLPASAQINNLLGLGTDPAAAQTGFDQFRNSTGYDFRVNEGMRAVNSSYAGAGTLKSGAALKGVNSYGQGMATQEFGNYLNALGNQQALGLQAGSSLAGVGQNAANSLGNIYTQNGANQANAALAKASALGGSVSGAANIAGSILAPQSNSGLSTAGLNAMVANNNSYLAGKYGA